MWQGCNVYWLDKGGKPAIMERLAKFKPWQCFNHFPGMHNIANKARMAQARTPCYTSSLHISCISSLQHSLRLRYNFSLFVTALLTAVLLSGLGPHAAYVPRRV